MRMEFKYDGAGLGKGGDVTLYYDGKSVGQGRVDRTQPMLLRRRGLRRRRGHRLTRIPGLRPHRQQVLRSDRLGAIDIGGDSQDHLIKPEDRLTIAMARQ